MLPGVRKKWRHVSFPRTTLKLSLAPLALAMYTLKNSIKRREKHVFTCGSGASRKWSNFYVWVVCPLRKFFWGTHILITGKFAKTFASAEDATFEVAPTLMGITCFELLTPIT